MLANTACRQKPAFACVADLCSSVVPNINLSSAQIADTDDKEGGAMSRDLPAHPNLEHLKNQAKELLKDFERGNPAAVERFRSLGSLYDADRPKLECLNRP